MFLGVHTVQVVRYVDNHVVDSKESNDKDDVDDAHCKGWELIEVMMQ